MKVIKIHFSSRKVSTSFNRRMTSVLVLASHKAFFFFFLKHPDVVYTDGFPSVDHTSLSKSGKLNSGSHCCLSSEILSRAYIISCINRLKVFNSDDTLGDSCGVPQSSVDQSPGVLNGHGPFILFKDGTQTEARGDKAALLGSHPPNPFSNTKHMLIEDWFACLACRLFFFSPNCIINSSQGRIFFQVGLEFQDAVW